MNLAYVANGLNHYTTVAGVTRAYDTNNNLTGDGTRAFAYDVENRLTSLAGGAACLSVPPARTPTLERLRGDRP